jgi:hypothetical protein
MVQIGDHLREMCNNSYFLLLIADGCRNPASVSVCTKRNFQGAHSAGPGRMGHHPWMSLGAQLQHRFALQGQVP